LEGGDAPVADGGVPLAEQELDRGAAEGVEAFDGEVLLVAAGLEDEVLGCLWVGLVLVLVFGWGRERGIVLGVGAACGSAAGPRARAAQRCCKTRRATRTHPS
jgi:hypothetical protein